LQDWQKLVELKRVLLIQAVPIPQIPVSRFSWYPGRSYNDERKHRRSLVTLLWNTVVASLLLSVLPLVLRSSCPYLSFADIGLALDPGADMGLTPFFLGLSIGILLFV